jgi:hypothetical protein
MRRGRQWAVLLLAATTLAWAQPAHPLAEALAELEEPLTVRTRMGRDFRGHPLRVSPAGLVLRAFEDAGEVEFEFAREDILAVRFPGHGLTQQALDLAAEGELAAALTVVDRLFLQRSAFFPYTGEREVEFFVETLPLYREAGRLFEALARAEVIAPFVEDPALRQALARERMLGSLHLGMADEARTLAASAIEREGRAPRTALPALVRAHLELAAGEGEAALFTLLHPLVFSGAREVAYLDLCYAMAIGLARQLDEPALAARLVAERERRNVGVPVSWDPLPPPDFTAPTSLSPPP